MKRTNAMKIIDSEEAAELMLYAVNSGELYVRNIIPVIKNLAKKYRRGVFDSGLAIDAFYRVACFASDMYFRDFGHRFTVTERFTAAAHMVAYFLEDIETESV